MEVSQNKYFNRSYLVYGTSQSFGIWNLNYVEARASTSIFWLKSKYRKYMFSWGFLVFFNNQYTYQISQVFQRV